MALRTAIANALVDTFCKKYPKDMYVVEEDVKGNHGKVLGCNIAIKGIPVSILATVNATYGGLGPNEDLEGNVMLGNKGKLMKNLNLGSIPTIIVESKIYMSRVCDKLEQKYEFNERFFHSLLI